MPSYFTHLPNIYVAQSDEQQQITYQLVKNIFRRVIIQERLDVYGNEFEAYTIRDGQRPDSIAHLFFGDASLDWIILITNGIIDRYEQWPRSDYELLEYTKAKYGDHEAIHHYETREVLWDNAVFIKEGLEVNSSWRTKLPNGNVLSENDSVYPVTNIEYEITKNEKKRLIAIPSQRLLEFYEEEFRNLVDYETNKEVDTDGNKKTVLSIVGAYLDRASYKRNLSAGTVVATSADNGITASSIAGGNVAVIDVTETSAGTFSGGTGTSGGGGSSGGSGGGGSGGGSGGGGSGGGGGVPGGGGSGGGGSGGSPPLPPPAPTPPGGGGYGY